MKNLEKIAKKYSEINHNEENFEIGGGLSDGKFASNRHEDAKNDEGKLTLGKAVQMFKKATENDDTDFVKEVLCYAIPNMEWHHAGKLPKVVNCFHFSVSLGYKTTSTIMNGNVKQL